MDRNTPDPPLDGRKPAWTPASLPLSYQKTLRRILGPYKGLS